MYSIQCYVIKFVNNLRQFGGFLRALRFPPQIKLTATIYLVTEILLKVALITINQTLSTWIVYSEITTNSVNTIVTLYLLLLGINMVVLYGRVFQYLPFVLYALCQFSIKQITCLASEMKCKKIVGILTTFLY